MEFGKAIKRAREQMNLSQEEASRKIEEKYKVRLSPSYLSMIENGIKTNLTTKLVSSLEKFFNLECNSNQVFSNEEMKLIFRFRKLSPDSQHTVITLIDNLEIIDNNLKNSIKNKLN